MKLSQAPLRLLVLTIPVRGTPLVFCSTLLHSDDLVLEAFDFVLLDTQLTLSLPLLLMKPLQLLLCVHLVLFELPLEQCQLLQV